MVSPVALVRVVLDKYFEEASNDSDWEDAKEAVSGVWKDIENAPNERPEHKRQLAHDLVEIAHDEHEKKVFYISKEL